MSRPRPAVAIGLAAAALALLPVLASCGSGSSSGASSATMADRGESGGGAAAGGVAEPAPASAAAPAGDAARSATQGKAVAGPSANAAPNPTVKLVRTADLVIEVKTLRTAAAQVRAVAESTGGTVSSETTSFAATGPVPAAGSPDAATSGGAVDKAAGKPATPVQPGESVLVLRVPVASLDQVVERVAAVGKELSRTSSALDVTADLADLGSRVKTQQASVERVRALLARAQSLQDVVLLESELSRREADLEALQARQSSLAGRADLSTLTVTLRTPDVAPPATEEDNGFLKGLKQGWRAVVGSTAVVLTLLGALLPILVAAAVIGLPVWWFARRRRAARPAPAPVATGLAPRGPAPDAPDAPDAPPSPQP